MIDLLWKLVIAHMVGDWWAQSDSVAQRKNHLSNPMPAVPWYYWLSAHAIIHGGLVTAVAGSTWLGIAEAIAHGVCDYAKCDGRITLHQDQAFHLACKLAWACVAVAA